MAFWHSLTLLPLWHRRLILLLGSLILLLLLWPLEKVEATRATTALPQTNPAASGHRLGEVEPDEPDEAPPGLQGETLKVRNGDNLAELFQRAGFDPATLHQVLDSGEEVESLIRLKPGEEITFYQNDEGALQALSYPMGLDEILWVEQARDGFACRVEKIKLERRQQIAQGTIDSSFWEAGQTAGLNNSLILGLANIFAWDIDFAQDLQPGDSFSLIYEELYRDDEKLSTGKILAAEFINQGQRYLAVRHRDGHYYSPQGKAMRKGFLRAPVNFRYITSNFNPRRKHPVTGLVRPHNGIDYGAPVGTPIMAAGDGVVSASSYNGLNGNFVFIRHSGRYTTKYLHLSQREVKVGQRVKQGQTIGRLGGTGRVTGPHLHYEFLVDGVHKNPKTVALPEATPLSGQPLNDFKLRAHSLLARLALVEPGRLAQVRPAEDR
ncbi:peptidoglycan DD-metalloendopeptidase family protein [Pseudaeromonas paramecii]|uniref:Peptidoglycan DD-metalloendopeptidase family protein n=1 Tax=Pseudaeromonas paramecii TaxID=2138166 RepID=A0ABP8Q659_9GAMM